ncbi:MAG: hypothetical protein ACRCZ0_12560 [Cetobacterium sp.]
MKGLNMEEKDLLKLITIISFRKFNDVVFHGIETNELEKILPHIELSIIGHIIKKNNIKINRSVSYPLRVLEILGYIEISFRGKKKYIELTDSGKSYFKDGVK